MQRPELRFTALVKPSQELGYIALVDELGCLAYGADYWRLELSVLRTITGHLSDLASLGKLDALLAELTGDAETGVDGRGLPRVEVEYAMQPSGSG